MGCGGAHQLSRLEAAHGHAAALPATYRPVLALALSPDATRLAVGCGSEVVLYDVSGAGARGRGARECASRSGAVARVEPGWDAARVGRVSPRGDLECRDARAGARDSPTA